MDITYYKIENDAIKKIEKDLKVEEWNVKVDWIDIRSENRKEAADYFKEQNLYDENVRACIEHPEQFPFSNTFDKNVILNLSVSSAANIYKTEYITIIIEHKLIIVLSLKASDFFNERYLALYSEKKIASLKSFLLYVLVAKTISQGNANMSIARNRLQGIDFMLANDPDKLSSKDVMSCERDISQLSDIIEDQYVGFGILASLSSADENEDIQKTSNIIKGFEPMDKAMLRLEKKAESLRLQYMLIQQEKSTKKINMLTIIQALFVPMTFVAGVYGMNFVNMPELNWPLGYLFVWILFIGMAGGLLIYFYRKGWFN